jgi:hypothetical protein
VVELYKGQSADYRCIISEHSAFLPEKTDSGSKRKPKAGQSATRILLAVENTSKLFTTTEAVTTGLSSNAYLAGALGGHWGALANCICGVLSYI